MLATSVPGSRGSGVLVTLSQRHYHGSFSLRVPDTPSQKLAASVASLGPYPTLPNLEKLLSLSSQKELSSPPSVVKKTGFQMSLPSVFLLLIGKLQTLSSLTTPYPPATKTRLLPIEILGF